MDWPAPPPSDWVAFTGAAAGGDRPFRLAMGLRPLDPSDWLTPDDHASAEMAAKAVVLAAHHDEAVAALPGSEAAAAELLALVEARPGEISCPHGGSDLSRSIDAAGRSVQDDLCLLDRTGVFVAGSLCFPLRWRLRDKLGLPLTGVHGPVAHYPEQLAAPVDRFLDRLRPERPVWRINWNVVDSPELFQPVAPPHDPAAGLWLRVERQTLRRLPVTGAVVFGIRTRQWPLEALTTEQSADLAAAMRRLSPASWAYKGFAVYGDAALAVLDTRAQPAG